ISPRLRRFRLVRASPSLPRCSPPVAGTGQSRSYPRDCPLDRATGSPNRHSALPREFSIHAAQLRLERARRSLRVWHARARALYPRAPAFAWTLVPDKDAGNQAQAHARLPPIPPPVLKPAPKCRAQLFACSITITLIGSI